MADRTPPRHPDYPVDPKHGDRDSTRRRHRRHDPPSACSGLPTSWPPPHPAGDVVPGDPPVPITVWHLPRPRPGRLASTGMLRRLIGNYTRPGGLVVDLTAAGTLPPPGYPVALVVTGCPDRPEAVTAHLAGCAAGLQPGGCLAVVLPTPRTVDQLGQVVSAGRAAGLTYLQHIVVAHQLVPRTSAGDDPRTRLGTPSSPSRPRVHSDVLILRRPGLTAGELR